MYNIKTKEKLDIAQIREIFTSGFKPVETHKIGIEYERLPVFNDTYRAVPYEDGVCNVLRTIARDDNWDYITDDFNIIGLKQNHDTVTLEPGCQFEMSLEPEFTIKKLEEKINAFNKKIAPILERNNMKLLEYGVSPVSTHKSISLIPKKRYHIMARYLWGILSDVMMRETAGSHCCIDFESEEDLMKKFETASKLSPFITAMFANSPIRGGVYTGYKSFRALSWLNTDNDRCGFAGNLKKEFSIDDYINCVLDSPMIFITRENLPIQINGRITFRDFMNKGFEGFEAAIEDFELHANLYFPEVRLRNFIEIRNHDCVGKGLQYSLLAIYKGILYDKYAISEFDELMQDFSVRDITELRYNVPKSAMQSKIGKYMVSEIAPKILEIAEKALIGGGYHEDYYLDPVKEYVEKGICPADVIIRSWHSVWDKDINRLIKFLTE